MTELPHGYTRNPLHNPPDPGITGPATPPNPFASDREIAEQATQAGRRAVADLDARRCDCGCGCCDTEDLAPVEGPEEPGRFHAFLDRFIAKAAAGVGRQLDELFAAERPQRIPPALAADRGMPVPMLFVEEIAKLPAPGVHVVHGVSLDVDRAAWEQAQRIVASRALASGQDVNHAVN